MVLFALLACSQPRGLLLLDAQSRQSGWAVEIDGRTFDTPLPIVVPAAAEVALLDSNGDRSDVQLGPNELAWVRSSKAILEVRPLHSPSLPLRIFSDGDVHASDLAAQIGADTTIDWGPGAYDFAGDYSLEEAAWMDDHAIDEVIPLDRLPGWAHGTSSVILGGSYQRARNMRSASQQRAEQLAAQVTHPSRLGQ